MFHHLRVQNHGHWNYWAVGSRAKVVEDETYGDRPSEAKLASRVEHEDIRWGYELQGQGGAQAVLKTLKKGANP